MTWLLVLVPLAFALGFCTCGLFVSGKIADLQMEIDLLRSVSFPHVSADRSGR